MPEFIISIKKCRVFWSKKPEVVDQDSHTAFYKSIKIYLIKISELAVPSSEILNQFLEEIIKLQNLFSYPYFS